LFSSKQYGYTKRFCPSIHEAGEQRRVSTKGNGEKSLENGDEDGLGGLRCRRPMEDQEWKVRSRYNLKLFDDPVLEESKDILKVRQVLTSINKRGRAVA
jgi:hypothetical protein